MNADSDLRHLRSSAAKTGSCCAGMNSYVRMSRRIYTSTTTTCLPLTHEEDYPMKRYIRLTTIISLLALLFTISGAALAQEVTANLNGNVKDTTGALVKGATVTVTDTDKKVVVRTLTTGDEGEWAAPNLLAGNYS